MDKVIRIIVKLLFVGAAVCCVYITVKNVINIQISSKGTIFIVDEYVPTYYEMLSDNVGLTTVNGISNVYVNMKKDGYAIHNEVVTNNSIDVSFTKENEPSYRYYFTYPEGRITFFCSEYENSYTGLSYILDRKE